MANKHKLLVNGLILILFLLSACSKGASSTEVVNKFPPFQTIGYEQQTNDIAQTKYVIADMQLGGTQVQDYYRDYASQDPIIQQAVYYYDSGIRIVNIYQFTRVEVGNDGWQVIYGGTDNTICQGDDIVLTNEIFTTDGTAFEAQVRYILADIQLGDVAEYYRQFTDQPAVADAISRWDAGVRVTNIDQFERRILFYAGWKILYIGTDTPIDGMDVVLSGDTSGSIPSAPSLPGYDSIWSGPANGSFYLNLSGDETVWGSWNIDWGDGTMDTQTLPAFHQYDSIVDKHLLILRMCRVEDNLCINAEVWNAMAMLDLTTYPPFRITSVEP
jgi:hypothetical protein